MRKAAKILSLAIAVSALSGPSISYSADPGMNSVAPLSLGRKGLDKATTLTKPVVIARLKDLQKKQTQSIDSATQSIAKIIQETQSIKLGANDTVVAERQLQSTTKRLAALREQKEEATLRYEFFEQLIFQFDSKWSNQPIAVFLERNLLDMAATDLMAAGIDKGDLWRFYTLLSVAVREIPEPREDLLSFLDGYVEFSTVKNPKSPALYLSSRHYTNGAVNEMAKSTDRDQLSAGIDKRLKDLESIGVKSQEQSSPPAGADIELRAKIPIKQ